MGPESGLMMGVPEAGLEDFKIYEWQEGEGNGGSNNRKTPFGGKNDPLFL